MKLKIKCPDCGKEIEVPIDCLFELDEDCHLIER